MMKKMYQRVGAVGTAAVLTAALSVPAFAAGTYFVDVESADIRMFSAGLDIVLAAREHCRRRDHGGDNHKSCIHLVFVWYFRL